MHSWPSSSSLANGNWEWVMVMVSDQPGGCISLKALPIRLSAFPHQTPLMGLFFFFFIPKYSPQPRGLPAQTKMMMI
jgi:hypothetical protein